MQSTHIDELGSQKALYRLMGKLNEAGILVASMHGIDCDYRYPHAGHSYLFYRIERNKVVIVEMFDGRECLLIEFPVEL